MGHYFFLYNHEFHTTLENHYGCNLLYQCTKIVIEQATCCNLSCSIKYSDNNITDSRILELWCPWDALFWKSWIVFDSFAIARIWDIFQNESLHESCGLLLCTLYHNDCHSILCNLVRIGGELRKCRW